MLRLKVRDLDFFLSCNISLKLTWDIYFLAYVVIFNVVVDRLRGHLKWTTLWLEGSANVCTGGFWDTFLVCESKISCDVINREAIMCQINKATIL